MKDWDGGANGATAIRQSIGLRTVSAQRLRRTALPTKLFIGRSVAVADL
jgi:hypothetical protein